MDGVQQTALFRQLDRAPRLQRPMADIRERRTDIVMAYKGDRLTHSLAEFATLVEHSVSGFPGLRQRKQPGGRPAAQEIRARSMERLRSNIVTVT
jgi:hypothetical protein